MTDLITHLAARTLQLTPVAQPRIDSVFAAQQTSIDWQSVSQSAGSEVVSPTSSQWTKPPASLVSSASPVLPIAHIPRLAELPFPSGGLAMASGRAVEQEASVPELAETGAIESSDAVTSLSEWQPLESTPAANIPINIPAENLNLPPQPNPNSVENSSLPIAPPLPPAPLAGVIDSAVLPPTKGQSSPPPEFTDSSQTTAPLPSVSPFNAQGSLLKSEVARTEPTIASSAAPIASSQPPLPLAESPDHPGKLISAPVASSIQAVHSTQAGEATIEATASKPDAMERQTLQSSLREDLPVPSQPPLKPLIKPASLSIVHPSSIANPVIPQGTVPIAQPRFHAAESSLPSRSAISPISSPIVPPTVNITIGRIDIRAVPAASPSPTRRAAPAAPKLALQDYLNTRNGGGG